MATATKFACDCHNLAMILTVTVRKFAFRGEIYINTFVRCKPFTLQRLTFDALLMEYVVLFPLSLSDVKLDVLPLSAPVGEKSKQCQLPIYL